MSESSFRDKVKHNAAMLYILLCYNMIHTQSIIASFGNDGLCCKSPDKCSISDCGDFDSECCRLNDDYVCDNLNYTLPNIYEGSFRIPITDNSEDNVYFRLYPDHIYIEYTLPSDDQSIGISWHHYDHPIPDLQFTIFASDTDDNDNWKTFDILTQKDTYRMWSTNTEYDCDSLSGYCVPDLLINFNYQTAYNTFAFTQIMPNNQSVFVWERQYSVRNGLFQYDGLYESVNNNTQICWNYAILEGNTIGNGGENIDTVDTVCTTVHNICGDQDEDDDDDDDGNDKMCAMNKVDLVIILDITLSHNVWPPLQQWIANVIIDIHHKLHDDVAADILFRVSLITYGDEYFDVLQTLNEYNWGNNKVLIDNLIYDMDQIIIKSPNRSTTAQLKSALHVATSFIFPESGENDILFALLITDEVVTRNEDKPCLDTSTINAFNAFHPIFGAVFVDEHHDDEALQVFIESVDCLVGNYSHSYSVIETNSSVDPSSSFHSFYDFVDHMDISDLNIHSDSCDSMVNITWPLVDFEYFVPFNECIGTDMDLVFIIDLTPKSDISDCFKCWMDDIASIITVGFELVQNVTAFTSSLHIAIVTFDGIAVHVYYNLNDAAISTYPQISQIVSLLDSLVPVLDEYDESFLEDAIAVVKDEVFPYKSQDGVLQSFIWSDNEEVYIANANTSYKDVCDEMKHMDQIYLIYDYESLQDNLFPLYRMDCMGTYHMEREENILVMVDTSNNYAMNQIYITMTHTYCPQECFDCNVPLFDASKDLQTTLLLTNWLVNKPMTAGWNITTSPYSFHQVITSVDVYFYGLQIYHQVQVSIYDEPADKYISRSMGYPGQKGEDRYSIELPIKDDYGEYNYLAPNHEYSISIELHNITKKDAQSIQIVLQNVTDNMYYEPESTDHFTNMSGLLFIFSEYFPFSVNHNAISSYTPFGSICIVCVGDDDTVTLSPTTQTTSEPLTSIPTDIPETTIVTPSKTSYNTSIQPTDLPSIQPTIIPSGTPTTEPTFELTYISSHNPTSEPTIEPTEVPSETPTGEPTIEPTDVPSETPTDEPTIEPTNIPSKTPTNEPTFEQTDTPTNTPTTEPTVEPTDLPSETPTNTPSKTTTTPIPTTTYITPTISLTPEPTERDCPDIAPDAFCQWDCNHDMGNPTEWQLDFISYKYNPSTDTTTFNYKAETLSSVTDDWCNHNHKNIQSMTIIFLYASTCCELSSDSQYLRNITIESEPYYDNDKQVSLWGINGDHWIFYPFALPSGTSSYFSITLHGEYMITSGSFVASHKSWFDGSRPNHRCGSGTVYVPDICSLETKSIIPTVFMTTPQTTDKPSLSPTVLTQTPTETTNVNDCGTLSWPDLQNDCEQYCLSETTNVEWDMAHISTLYNSLLDTTTIAWSVTVQSNHWGIDDWCFPESFGPSFNYPESLKRVLIRFDSCCSGTIPNTYLIEMIDGVSDDGDFSIILDDDHPDMVSGIQWDNINLKKGKTGLFFVSFKGNMTLIDGDYWFFGGNQYSRCTSKDVKVPDICYALTLNDFQFDDDTDSNPNSDKDWYLEWLFMIGKLDKRRMLNTDGYMQWIDNNHAFLCEDWMDIVHLERDDVKHCNVSILNAQQYTFKIDIIVHQQSVNDSQIIKLKSQFKHNTEERSMAQRHISEDISSIYGIEIDVECNEFVVSEIESTSYYINDKMHSFNSNIWSVILIICAMLIVLCIFILHRYYPENKQQLIHQIEDLFMQELYENNRNKIQEQDYNEQNTLDILEPIIEEELRIDDDGSSISNLSSDDTDHSIDNVSLEMGWNGECKL